MATITPFHQEKLASSMVGTSGVNPAGQMLAGTITRSTGAVGDTAVAMEGQEDTLQQHALRQSMQSADSSVEQIGAQLMRQRLEQAQREKALKDLNDKTAIDVHKLPLAYTLNDLQLKVQERNKANPLNAVQDFRDSAPAEIDKILGQPGISDNQVVHNGLQSHADAMVEAIDKSLHQQSMSAYTDNNIAAVKSTISNLVGTSGSNGAIKTADLGGTFKAIDSMKEAVRNITTSPDEANGMMQKAKVQSTMNWAKAAIAGGDYETVDKLLKMGALDHTNDEESRALLDAGDKKQLSDMVVTARNSASELLKEADKHDKVANDHKIMDIMKPTLKADYKSADYLSINQAAKDKLQIEYDRVSALPESAHNITVMKEIKSAINETDSNMDAKNREIDQAKDEADREASKEAKANVKEKAKEAKDDLKAKQKAKIDAYNSAEGNAARATMTEQRKQVDQKGISDDEKFRRIQEATQHIKDATKDGYIIKPTAGAEQSNKSDSTLGYYQAINDRLVSKAAKPSLMEMIAGQMSASAPDLVKHSLNPHNDPKTADIIEHNWSSLLKAEHDAAAKPKGEKGLGRQPDNKDIEQFIKPTVIRKMLGLSVDE